ncbi:MAG: cytochrome c-type biogenesis protein CcmH [Acidimicrobiia bacterium]|nr:cytochrome c-type biogenesis protein CcmH [Acidimicrobiia bacterium]
MSTDTRLRTTVSWTLIAIVAVAALAFGTLDEGGSTTNADRVFDLARSIRCPQCSGQSVAESDVAIAREIRADIAVRVDAGESDEAIQQVYVDRYGSSILLTPSGSGLEGLVWIIPIVGVAAAIVVLGFAFSRWRRAAPAMATDADVVLVDQARRRGG